MKRIELRKLIKEEINRILKEDPIPKVKQGDLESVLQFGKDDPKLGKEVIGGYKAVRPYITGASAKNLDKLESMGIKFDEAYLIFKYQTGRFHDKDRNTATWNFLGKDSKGNDIRYYKYEGYSLGSGQSYIFVNGVKGKLSDYLICGGGLPQEKELQKSLGQITGHKGWYVEYYQGRLKITAERILSDEIFNRIKLNKNKISAYLLSVGLIGYSAFYIDAHYGRGRIYIAPTDKSTIGNERVKKAMPLT